jgi:hypothetical protein
MTTRYRHTQRGHVTAVALGAGLAFAIHAVVKGEASLRRLLPVVGVLGGVALLFSGLTIEVADGWLRSKFGPGLPARSVPLEEIEDVRVTRNEWYEGWGIRVTRRGMLYNVSGFLAVEVVLRDGTSFRLGTDEPERLREAILAARGSLVASGT